MLRSTENRRPLLGVITPYAFENRAAIAHNVGKNVNFRVVPGDEPPIVPNLFCSLQHIEIISMLSRLLLFPEGNAKNRVRVIAADAHGENGAASPFLEERIQRQ